MATRRYVRNGTRDAGKYSIVNTLNSRILDRMKGPIRNYPNTRAPRPLAFAVYRSFADNELQDLRQNLGKAINLSAQPDEFKQMFAADGSIKQENLSQIAFITFIDRYRESFVKDPLRGTNVPNQNIRAIFNDPPPDLLNRGYPDVLVQYVERSANSREPPSIVLGKGSASKLLEHLLGPESPLAAEGFKYVVLHAASQGLATSYYQRLFGFQPLYGVPNAEYPLGEEFDTQPNVPAPSSLASWDVKQINHEYYGIVYVRRVGDQEYITYESESAGPILYKKLETPAPAPGPGAAAPAAAQESIWKRVLPRWMRGGKRTRKGSKRAHTQKRRVR